VESPPETNRTGRAKPELRHKSRQLRAQGLTITEIAEITGASKGSISPWIRDIGIPARVEELRREHLQRLRRRGADARHNQAMQRTATSVAAAEREIGQLSDRELLIVGAALTASASTRVRTWMNSSDGGPLSSARET
jgi:hypothetical protein